MPCPVATLSSPWLKIIQGHYFHFVLGLGNINLTNFFIFFFRLLTEMMDHWDSRSSGPEERDLLKELHDSCVKMQPKLLRLAAGLDTNSS